jgi:hypothetical protein
MIDFNDGEARRQMLKWARDLIDLWRPVGRRPEYVEWRSPGVITAGFRLASIPIKPKFFNATLRNTRLIGREQAKFAATIPVPREIANAQSYGCVGTGRPVVVQHDPHTWMDIQSYCTSQ